jgi:predicted RNA polymerase sigma factor
VRANVMRTLGRTDDALADYRRALELNPDERTRRAAEAGLSELRPAAAKPGD